MSYSEAKVRYEKILSDPEKAMKILKGVPVSLHCWQGDDVRGFDGWHTDYWQLSVSGDDISGTNG